MKRVLGMMGLGLLLWGLPSGAHAAGTWSCSSSCMKGDSEESASAGQPTTPTITISSATAGYMIVVASRGGSNSTTVTVVNEGGPATLLWSLVSTRANAPGTSWVHTVHCAMVPTTGTYTFHTTNNTSPTTSGRSVAVLYNTGTCVGAQAKSNAGVSYGGTPVDPTVQNLVVSQTSLMFSTVATDSDLDHTGPLAATGGYIIRNPQCNRDIEPDQKLCVADGGTLAAATHRVDYTLAGGDSWIAHLVAFPSGGAPPDVTPPPAPTGLTVR